MILSHACAALKNGFPALANNEFAVLFVRQAGNDVLPATRPPTLD
jgi:hypothetical protein